MGTSKVNSADTSRTSPFFTVEKVFYPSGKPAIPARYSVVHTESSSPYLPSPGLRVMVTRSRGDAEKAIAELLEVGVDWSRNLYGEGDLYEKCEPVLLKYHCR